MWSQVMTDRPTRAAAQDLLKPAIEKLETCLVTPVVPGELPSWTANARSAFDEVIKQWQGRRAAEDKNLQEIGEQDSELLYRVEQLKAEREEVWRHAQELGEALHSMEHRAEAVEPDELRAEKLHEDTKARGLDFVLRLRALDAALTTWLLEAFQRDRGVGD